MDDKQITGSRQSSAASIRRSLALIECRAGGKLLEDANMMRPTTPRPTVANPNTGLTDPRQGIKGYNEWADEVAECAEYNAARQEKHGNQQTKIVTVDGIRVEVEMDFDPALHEFRGDFLVRKF